ncbi:NUDIX hydrolase [Paenibacillus dakarensis]|uniref:NUDIX hydrolase n=1 Tax=Paenibacillus dakarensis TaxID=1527293 RepID=UPI0006D53874|nr:NUDIX hydrolase [Paenibacillus dakarensis]
MNRSIYYSEYYAIEETKEQEIIVIDMLPESTAVVVYHQGCMLLVSQYREAVGERTWELPGGTIQPGEDKQIAVQRELEEEAGVLCGEFKHLGSAFPMASLANRQVHFYFTDDVRKVTERKQEDDEDVTPMWIPLRDVYRKVRDGGTDSMLGHAMMLCMLHGLLKPD